MVFLFLIIHVHLSLLSLFYRIHVFLQQPKLHTKSFYQPNPVSLKNLLTTTQKKTYHHHPHTFPIPTQENKTFEGNKGTYDDMRAKIRARTTDLSMEKSVTTAEAIKAATNRAMAGEAASTPTVDLSKFNDALLENPEDELTDEQKAEIDTVGQLNLWEQAVAEYKYTRFPTASSILKQAGLMAVIFAVTATVILKVDELLRFQYTDWGLIPRSGEIMDYSDLTLPEGFTDQMNDEDLSKL